MWRPGGHVSIWETEISAVMEIVDDSDVGDREPNSNPVEDGNIGNSRDVSDGDPIFSVEEELRYAHRFEEGYDLFDSRYEAWLEVNHPEIVRDNVRDILEPFTPVVTLHVVSHLCDSSSPSLSCPSNSNTLSGSLTLSSTPQKSNSSPPTKHSPFSDWLNIPPLTSTPKMPKTGNACVLTSSEYLQLLKEKENQKQKVAAEKERRKLERELRKKQEQKRKADEKARKAAEREAAKVKKVEEKQIKSLEKALKRIKA